MVMEKARKPLPPYVSYRTFRNFTDGLQMGIPDRIDRSYWGERYSGSNGTQLMTALRFLGLVDSGGIPTTRLRQLVAAKGMQRSETLKQIGNSAYNFLVDRSLDLQVATYAQLEEAFYQSYGVTGDVARKCIKFFVSLEGDAGISLSPFILKKSKTTRAGSGRKKNAARKRERTSQNGGKLSAVRSIPDQNSWYEMVLAKFPSFDPGWPDDIKLKWFEAFESLLKRGLVSDTTQ
ncbi:MAG: DUF5343 domain-containing protein [Dehalococcoidales bacterium]|nr:MAG: DUF5343 domain-containing protein [Dehalococcoidales bacterium]